jgi:putative PIN family toxin of toxin-antitoxin system
VALDTNVLVSALVTPEGTCARILTAITSGKIAIILDERIITEYATVLSRPKLHLDPNEVELVLHQLAGVTEWVAAPPAGIHLPDETDVKFVEVALAAAANCVITGNTRHFPAKACRKVRILTPAQFLASAR